MNPSTARSAATAARPAPAAPHSGAVMHILGAVFFVHLLNDLVQAMLPSIYPMLKTEFGLNFTQVGLITLTFQCTASLLQPWIGLYTDRRPLPFLLPLGMCFSMAGVLMLALVSSFPTLLIAAGLIGVGSSTFHPEASRSRCSRSAATSARRSDHCWRRPSSSAGGRAISPGSR